MKPSFSLKSIFIGMAMVGLAIAVLLNAKEWRLSIVASLTIGSLLYAGLRAIVSGRKTPFWLGYALVGSAWFGFTFFAMGDNLRDILPFHSLCYKIARAVSPLPPSATKHEVAKHDREFVDTFLFGMVAVVATIGGVVAVYLCSRTEGPCRVTR